MKNIKRVRKVSNQSIKGMSGEEGLALTRNESQMVNAAEVQLGTVPR